MKNIRTGKNICILILILMTICASAYAEDLVLASWNIRILSNKSRSDSELTSIASIINRYDIIAIQEVRDTIVLDRLRERLPANWDYIASKPVGRGVKELYAFFYRTDRVTPITAVMTLEDPDDHFIREPAIASFSTSSFDFTLVTIHVIYGHSVAERREEVSLLDDVLTLVDGENGAEEDVILLGDFNMDADDESWQIQGYIPVISPTQMTTVTDTSSYDNIWLSEAHTYCHEFSHLNEIYRFDEEVFGGDDDTAKLICSDHRPISVVFSSDSDDDGEGDWDQQSYRFAPDANPASTPNDKLSHTTDSLYISRVITSPTIDESIYIYNPTDHEISLHDWRLGDKNNPKAYHFSEDAIRAGSYLVITHTKLNFQINNHHEIIYLYDDRGTLIDRWAEN